MNYSLSWSLGLPFSLFTWTLDMAFVNLLTPKFGFCLKNWPINMCIVPSCLSSDELEGGGAYFPPLP